MKVNGTKTTRLSSPDYLGAVLTAAILAIICGLLDAVVIAADFLGAKVGFAYVPSSLFIAAPIVWLFCAGIASSVIFLFPFFLRHRRAVYFLMGPGVLIAIRVVRPLAVSVNHSLLMTLFLVVLVLGMLIVERFHMFSARSVATAMVLCSLSAAGYAAAAMKNRAVADEAIRPVASREDAPNVILIFLDTLREDHTGLSQPSLARMPNLDQFGKSAVVFTQAYSPASWTLPSHASVLTGLSAPKTGCGFDIQTIDRNAVTLAERFHAAGYRTSAVFANAYLNPGSGLERGYDVFEYPQKFLTFCRTAPFVAIFGRILSLDALFLTTGDTISRRAVELLEDEQRPQFITLNYMDAHMPYIIRDANGSLSGVTFQDRRAFVEMDRSGKPLSNAGSQRLHALYRKAVEHLDRQLAPVLQAAMKTRRETIVAIVGDHGEQLGKHDLIGHGNSLYRQALAVPLVIRAPALNPASIDTPVSTTSLYSTILSLAGELQKGPTLFSDADAGAPVLSWQEARYGDGSRPRLRRHRSSIVHGSFHLIAKANGIELYDLVADPAEEHDLGGDLRYRSTREALLSKLNEFSSPLPVRPANLDLLRSLGYLQ